MVVSDSARWARLSQVTAWAMGATTTAELNRTNGRRKTRLAIPRVGIDTFFALIIELANESLIVKMRHRGQLVG
jgi:hypothetical protein